MNKVRPKKSLGQHFLKDNNVAVKIVESLTETNYNSIIEVGPGMGVLTQYLLKKNIFFRAIEIDKESIDFLKNTYQKDDFVIEGDILKSSLSDYPIPIAIIGNFPYCISSQIFFKVLENIDLVEEVVCMIQKEVAQRISSPPGNKTYGILSVLLQAYFNIEYLFTVSEGCFSPPPKVKSAVIRLKRNSRAELPCDKSLFFRVVKQSFNQRRKTLRNSLKNICLNLDFSADIFNKRPEQLSIDEFIELTSFIETGNSNHI